MTGPKSLGGRPAIRAAAFTVWVLALAGVGYGALWAALSPSETLEVRDDGVYLLLAQGEGRIGSQLVFAGIGVAVGLLAAVRCWRRARFPIPMTAALTVGGLLAALVAWQVGLLLGPADIDPEAAVGSLLDAPLVIDAYGVLLAAALGAVGTWALLLFLTEDQDQRATAATVAPSNSINTEGESPTSSPRFPPET